MEVRGKPHGPADLPPNEELRKWRTQEFFSGGGVQQIQLRTEDRENGDLGAVTP